MTIAELLKKWRGLDSKGSDLFLQKGEILTEAKGFVCHGEWTAFLKQIDVSSRSAERFMRIFKLSTKAPTLADLRLSPSKLDTLGKIKDEKTLNQFIKDHEEELPEMPVRELNRLVNELIKKPKNEQLSNLKAVAKIEKCAEQIKAVLNEIDLDTITEDERDILQGVRLTLTNIGFTVRDILNQTEPPEEEAESA